MADHKQILQSLANGKDPFNGTALPNTSPYNHPAVIRALFNALQHMPTEKPKKDKPARAGRPWTDDERNAVIESFGAGSTISDIAAEHLRTRGAIRSELIKCGILREDEEVTPP